MQTCVDPNVVYAAIWASALVTVLIALIIAVSLTSK